MHFIFGVCVPSQSSPCTLAPLTVLARATGASRRPPSPPTLALLLALNVQLMCNGLAPVHDDFGHPKRLQSGRAMWPDCAASAALRRGAQASTVWCFGAERAVTACGCMWRKLGSVPGQFSRVRATLMLFSGALA